MCIPDKFQPQPNIHLTSFALLDLWEFGGFFRAWNSEASVECVILRDFYSFAKVFTFTGFPGDVQTSSFVPLAGLVTWVFTSWAAN